MSKILINSTPFDVEIQDVGVTVPALSSYTIPPQDYSTFAASSNIVTLIGSSGLLLNDGGNDITNISAAIDIIKGWPVQAGAASTPFFFDYGGLITGDLPVSIIFYTVPVGSTLNITNLSISCRIESISKVFKNGEVIADLRTGAARPDASFYWNPNRELISGDTLEVVLTKRSGTTDVEIGAHLMGVTT